MGSDDDLPAPSGLAAFGSDDLGLGLAFVNGDCASVLAPGPHFAFGRSFAEAESPEDIP